MSYTTKDIEIFVDMATGINSGLATVADDIKQNFGTGIWELREQLEILCKPMAQEAGMSPVDFSIGTQPNVSVTPFTRNNLIDLMNLFVELHKATGSMPYDLFNKYNCEAVGYIANFEFPMWEIYMYLRNNHPEFHDCTDFVLDEIFEKRQ